MMNNRETENLNQASLRAYLTRNQLDEFMKKFWARIEVYEPYKKNNQLYVKRKDNNHEFLYYEANPDILRHSLTNYDKLLQEVKELELSYNDQEALIFALKYEATRKVGHKQSQITSLWIKEVKKRFAQEVKKLKKQISNLTQQISNLTQQISNLIQENINLKKEQYELIQQKDETIQKLKRELEAVEQKSEKQKQEFEKAEKEYERKLQELNIEIKNDVENQQILEQFDPYSIGSDWTNSIKNPLKSSVRSWSQDLVRLYLQEIGRVPLLGRDEEVAEAQKVQRYMQLLELRTQAVGYGINQYVELMDLGDRLAAKLGHKPSFVRWARDAKLEVAELKQILTTGKQEWAKIAGLTVKELDQIQTEGIRAKEHMIKANLRLVVSVAKKYQNRRLELLDLVQEGTLGLERSVDKFDPTKGYRFSTYANWWIRQRITRAIATQSRTIRLPVHITEKLNKIKKVQRKLSQEKGRTPSIDDIARELDMTAPQVREVLLRVPRSVSLETKVGNEKDTELGDLLETDEIPLKIYWCGNPYNGIYKKC
jgi:RNA polymerase sigma factor (sigma-70 family)